MHALITLCSRYTKIKQNKHCTVNIKSKKGRNTKKNENL